MGFLEIHGNIFNSQAQALVNTVNCKGVMGRGIALEFRRRYPNMFIQYKSDCEYGKYSPGRNYYYKERGTTIINCAVKDHWRFPSKMSWIESCLNGFMSEYKARGIQSVAFPIMGAKYGKLSPSEVMKLMKQKLSGLTDLEIEIYEFTPNVGDPLFDRLVQLISSGAIYQFQDDLGLRKDRFQVVIDAVISKRVKSLHMLSSKNIVGEKSVDKIYALLIDTDLDDSRPAQLKLL